MRAFVFTDRALERQAGRFVWLSVNAERDRNAGFLEKHPIEAYPTILLIDPDSEQAILRWVGSATVPQLEKMFDDGERALKGMASGADAELAAADRLLGAGKNAEAAAAFKEALAKAPVGWPSRDRAVESLLGALSAPESAAQCVELAKTELPKERTQHYANVAMAGLGCAMSLEGSAKKDAISAFEPAVRSALGEPRIEMAADDRAGLYGALVDARKEMGDEASAKKIAAEWLAFLDEEASRTPSPQARAVLDSFRLAAAIEAGEPARAVAALERSEKELPGDYNPPARLAVAYEEMGRYDDALAAADRAMKLVYGPRKLRIFSTRAGILEKQGDKAGAREALQEALRYAETLPKAQVSARSVEALKARLAKLA